MEKHSWQKVTYNKATSQPPSRWGHSTVKVQQNLILFGGYAQSHYMNDVWQFNTNEMLWQQCKTYGNIPSPRSNSTIHYDPIHNYIILFGGGGPHKQRFNDVHLLNWSTKQWKLLVSSQNQKILWERTYHTSQLLYPYLIVFGGQGISDLDDLWAFHLQDHEWTQLKINEGKIKPCSRRFHSSVIIDNTFYVIAGCHDKYRCLCDIFSIDLTSFVKQHQIGGLQWKQLNIKNCSFLTRWGHTSTVYDNKIYIFGGRFSSDLQDILVVDPHKQTIKTMKVHGELPRPRRRHSATFVGSSLVVFGGFNGQYFNDLHYINVFELPSKIEMEQQTSRISAIDWVNKQKFSDYTILTDEGLPFYIHKGIISKRFPDEQQLTQFLNFIEKRYKKIELSQIMTVLYEGIGAINEKYFLSSFQINIHQNLPQKENSYLSSIDSSQIIQPFQLKPKNKPISKVLQLQEQNYSQYLENTRSNLYKDKVITLNQQYCLPVNSITLVTNCKYFQYLFQDHNQNDISIKLQQAFSDVRIFQVMLNYLQSNFVVVPKGIDYSCWIILSQLAQYFCLQNLSHICQIQLINHINDQNCQKLLQFAEENNLKLMASFSGEHLFRIRYQKDPISLFNNKIIPNEMKIQEKHLNFYFNLFRFDLQQLKLKNKQSSLTPKSLQISSQCKQNYQSIHN